MPASSPAENRNDRRRARTRQQLLEAANRLYREKGVEATTIKDITAEADVAHGSFYNHFKSMDEVASALAGVAIERVAAAVSEILRTASRVELLPCVGARVVIRTLLADPATRWMIGRPHIFVAEFLKVSVPFMRNAEQEAVASGSLRPVGGHQAWISTYPWLLLGQLSQALEDGSTDASEELFARISMRFLGIDDALANDLIAKSRRLVDKKLPRAGR